MRYVMYYIAQSAGNLGKVADYATGQRLSQAIPMRIIASITILRMKFRQGRRLTSESGARLLAPGYAKDSNQGRSEKGALYESGIFQFYRHHNRREFQKNAEFHRLGYRTAGSLLRQHNIHWQGSGYGR